LAKEEVSRGTRKRFYTTITDLAGTPVDPTQCQLRLEKVGVYTYDSPTQWYECSKVGTTGQYGADIWLTESMTLGDWIARFRWRVGSVWDGEGFEFTVIRKDKPYDNTPGPMDLRE
jgi:hypothetical protein